jgi:hypothetical protein
MLMLKGIPSFGEAPALFRGLQFDEYSISPIVGDGLVDCIDALIGSGEDA